MELLPTLLLGVLAVLSLLLLRAEGLLRRPKALFVCAVCVALAFFLRALCMEHRTLDYENFLSVWVAHFRQSGGFAGIAGMFLGVPVFACIYAGVKYFVSFRLAKKGADEAIFSPEPQLPASENSSDTDTLNV